MRPPALADFVSGRQGHGKTNFWPAVVKEKMRWRIAAGLLCLSCSLPGQAAKEAPTSDEAKKYFEEARALCERDGGTLWSKSLCGPILLVDAESRDAVAD